MAKAKKITRKVSGAGLTASVGNILDKGKRDGRDALFGSTNVPKVIANSVANISLDYIERNIEQPRTEFNEEALEDLVASIQEHGIIQPITVRKISDTRYQIISGERRWRASKTAGLTEIPAYVRDVNNDQLFEMAIVENLQREDLSTMEFLNSLKKLKYSSVDKPLTNAEIAKKIGKKTSTVTSYLNILKLERAIQESIEIGEISFSHAKALIGIADPQLRKDIYKDIIENMLSVRAVEAKVKAIKDAENEPKTPKASTKKPELSTEYAAVQQTLRDVLGNGSVKIKVDEEQGKGQIVVPFSSVQELNRMLDLLES